MGVVWGQNINRDEITQIPTVGLETRIIKAIQFGGATKSLLHGTCNMEHLSLEFGCCLHVMFAGFYFMCSVSSEIVIHISSYQQYG